MILKLQKFQEAIYIEHAKQQKAQKNSEIRRLRRIFRDSRLSINSFERADVLNHRRISNKIKDFSSLRSLNDYEKAA